MRTMPFFFFLFPLFFFFSLIDSSCLSIVPTIYNMDNWIYRLYSTIATFQNKTFPKAFNVSSNSTGRKEMASAFIVHQTILFVFCF